MSKSRFRSRSLPQPPAPSRRPRSRRPFLESLEARELLAVITVGSAGDASAPAPGDTTLSLREAIEINNGTLLVSSLSPALKLNVVGSPSFPALNEIDFALPIGVSKISVTSFSDLPAITIPVLIDGSIPAGSANPTVQLDGSGQHVNGLTIQSPNCIVEGMIVTGFTGVGIWINGPDSQGNLLEGNFISGNGIGVQVSSSNNRVNGNVIASNNKGMVLDAPPGTGTEGGTGVLVQNNKILGNSTQGVYIISSNNTIGSGNFIYGNGAQGVEIDGRILGGQVDPHALNIQGNSILGNTIGPAVGSVSFPFQPGQVLLLTQKQGVLILDSPKNVIGGNIIGENLFDGVEIEGGMSTRNAVLNNLIGFNAAGGISPGKGNQNGISVAASAYDNFLGGGNTISNNRANGILLSATELSGITGLSGNPGGSGNTVAGNTIGLSPNTLDGVHLDNVSNNVIGGVTVTDRNTISSNNNGVYIVGPGSTGNIVEGNFIGTGTDGVTDLGNAVDGVVIDHAGANLIGGVAPGAGNVISGNNRGVRITGASAQNNQVQGNFIGTDLTGKVSIHNEIDGVLITVGASNNLIGGAQGAGNTIEHNAGAGVNLFDGTGNTVLANSIFSNTDGSILLNVTKNANNLQVAPVLSSSTPTATSTNVQGILVGVPGKIYTIDYFSSVRHPLLGFEEGQTPLLTASVTVGPTGIAQISQVIPSSVPAGQYVTATATDSLGNTSEISNAVPAVPISLQFSAPTYTVNESGLVATITVTRGGGPGQTVTVDYITGGGTATAGVDYTTVAGTLIFGPNDTTKTFSVPILDSKKVGGSVTVNVTLGNPTGGALLGNPATSVISILDNDAPSVRLNAGLAAINENAGGITFTVSRNSPVGTMSVNYATADGTAHAGVNYVATVGTVTFLPGQTTAQVTVPVIDDHVVTGPLKFTLTLSNPTNNSVLGAPATATITVVNIDSPVVTGSSQSLSIIVNTTNDDTDPTDGTISLREAIELSDGTIAVSSLLPGERALVTVSPSPLPTGSAPPVPNTISFNLPGAGAGIQTITVTTTPLPAITAPVNINGYSQAGSAISGPDKTEAIVNDARVRIDGFSLGAPASGPGYDGLAIMTSNCVVNGLIVTGFSGAGISISGAGSQGNWLWGNFMGALPDPTFGRNFEVYPPGLAAAFQSQLGNLGSGVRITSSNNRVGGDSPGLPNVIANNGYDAAGNQAGGVGLVIDTPGGTGNLIQGNAIFNNAAQGVLVMSSNNTIGEAHVGGGNSIGDNGAQGVEITGGPTVQGNQLLGNFIGTDLGTPNGVIPKGTVPFPNFAQGILVQDSPKNTIGGHDVAARNIIGESLLDGVLIIGANATGNRLLNNYIGFNDLNGAIYFLPNQNGVSLTAGGNLIGDGNPGGGNTIDNNRNHGILLFGAGASGNTIEGDIIGLNPGGGSAFPNAFDGIHLDNAPDNIIGGVTVGARNVISSNNNGVYLLGAGSTGNTVEGNFIGTGTDGVTDLGNAVDGVVIDNAPPHTIGGGVNGAGNVISGNNRGVRITGAGSTKNEVQGNFIGTDLTGLAVVHNKIDGILVTAGASNNLIGGATNADGNTIANNAGPGVNLDDGTANTILSNSIFANIGHGIVLNPVTNANKLQPAPSLITVTPSGTSTHVQGTLVAAPDTAYIVQFFSSAVADPSGFGQGQTSLFTATVTTDDTGHATFSLDIQALVPSGQFVTATATDPLGNTSTFSNSLIAVPVGFKLGVANYTVNESDGAASITVFRTGGTLGSVSVGYAVGGGTAVAGTDYTATSGTLFFNPGDTSKTFVIPLIDAARVGGSVTANITLSNPTGGATLGSPATSVLTIQDNDQATVQFQPPASTTFKGAGVVTFTVVRNTAAGVNTVHFATANGSAIAGVNYTAASGALTFKAGETSKTIAITVLDDSHVHANPLTFTLTLSGVTGGVLGANKSITESIVTTNSPGTLQLATALLVTQPGATAATVTIVRLGGKTGTVSIGYGTGGGTATPGVDYTPVSGTVVFGPGETTKVVIVPLKGTSTPGPDLAFGFGLSWPVTGGAKVGTLWNSQVTIRHGAGTVVPPNPGDRTPPTVVDLLPVAGPQGVFAVVISFSKPMNPVRAQNVGNYGYFLTTPGPDGVVGTFDDGAIAITAAGYDAANQRTVLLLGSPLPLGTFAKITLNRNVNPALGQGLIDLNGNLLDGTGVGNAPGTPYSVLFAEGSQLNYTDRTGDAVSLALSGPGLISVRRGLDGEAQQLRFIGTAPGLDTLTGSVTRPRQGGNGTTSLPSIVGAAGVKIQLRTPPFFLGGISASAVDKLAVSGGLKAKP
jgi:CSLREA domain-containing protein